MGGEGQTLAKPHLLLCSVYSWSLSPGISLSSVFFFLAIFKSMLSYSPSLYNSAFQFCLHVGIT